VDTFPFIFYALLQGKNQLAYLRFPMGNLKWGYVMDAPYIYLGPRAYISTMFVVVDGNDLKPTPYMT
jgi:hypothetical protein